MTRPRDKSLEDEAKSYEQLAQECARQRSELCQAAKVEQWKLRFYEAFLRNPSLNAVLRVIRDLIVDECGFDRVGVFSYDAIAETFQGAWGTDLNGALEDLSSVRIPFHDLDGEILETKKATGANFLLRHHEKEEAESNSLPGTSPGRDHLQLFLSSFGELVGYIAIDNLLTHRPISESQIDELLRLTEYAANLVLVTAQRERHDRLILQQQRILEISLAITSNQDPDAIHLMVRNSIVEIGSVDRAAVWVIQDNVAHGTWGTNPSGELSNEHDISFPFLPESEFVRRFESPDCPFIINTISAIDQTGQTVEDVPHAFIPLRVAGEIIGIVTVDTLLSRRKITRAMLSAFMPIADQAAVAIDRARLIAQREAVVHQQKRLLEISVAIAANHDSDDVLQMVRDAILETGVVDRVGVWLVDGDTARGTWGTGIAGEPTDEHGKEFSLIDFRQQFSGCMSGDDPFAIADTYTVYQDNVRVKDNVPYAVIPLKTGNNLMGILGVDNLLTSRELTPDRLDLILPLAKQAAVALLGSRLRAERESIIRQQQRLMEIATAVTENNETDDVFRMVRDAILELGSVDRAGMWLIEGDIARGTWHTAVTGEATDEHEVSFSIAQSDEAFGAFIAGDASYLIDDPRTQKAAPGESGVFLPHALIALRAGSEVIGVLDIDNLLTYRPITVEDITPILPLAKLSAVVVAKSRLLSDAHHEIELRREAETLLLGRTEELIASRDQALAGVRAKSQFLANMSHEIRTPMNGVIGMISLLMLTPLSDRQLGYAKIIQKSAGALLSVIDDILDVSRIEVGKLKIVSQPFNLRECIEGVGEMVASQMKSNDIALSFKVLEDCPNLLIGDGDRIRQIITNLLGNAVKFTRKGEISVLASCISESSTEATVRIEVRDTGVGIAIDQHAAVFESFTQADGTSTRRHDGAGLGLTITKQLVELMGGTIHLESEPEFGTTVSLEINFAKPPNSVISQVAPPPKDAPELNLCVLVAEDNLVNMMVMTGRLEGWGCRCCSANNGIEALRAAAAQQIDLVLMDVSMPEMDGIEATRELRRLETTSGRHLPIIAMTAHALVGDRARCLAAGMDEYVSKPVNFDELLVKINRVLPRPRPSG